MERKGSSTAVVTKELVMSGLKTATTTSREEQALRMRYGASVDKKAALPQAHGGNEELADELPAHRNAAAAWPEGPQRPVDEDQEGGEVNHRQARQEVVSAPPSPRGGEGRGEG